MRAHAAHEQYRDSLRNALNALEAERVLPEVGHETAQTDIVGLLQRVAEADEKHPHYVIIITDLADTHYRTYQNCPRPRARCGCLCWSCRRRRKTPG
jgi:hypothetical protein